MELTSKQRAQLRGLANSIDTILQVGKDGIGANLIKQADDALEARELIKGRVLDNNIDYDARTAAEELAKATRSEVVQVIGTKFVLYRETSSGALSGWWIRFSPAPIFGALWTARWRPWTRQTDSSPASR